MTTTLRRGATTLALAALAMTLHAAPRTDFVVLNGEDPRSLDPQKVSTKAEARIALALFEGLVGYDAAGAARPGLAEKWTLAGTSATFALRRAQWSDGTPITARTVADSWQRGLAAQLPLLVRWVESVRAADEKTVEVTFTEPLPTLTLLADPAFAVIPMHLVEAHGTLWALPENLAVNGPFRVERWTPRSKLTVVPNPGYWDRARVGLTRITFLTGDFDAGETLFRAGATDWLPEAPVPRLNPDRRPRTDHVSLSLGSYFLRLNLTDPALADVRVRRALSLAFDRAVLVRSLRGAQPAFSLTPAMGDYRPPVLGADPAAARQLLAEAGYPGGKGFPPLTLLANTGETHRKVLEFLIDEWRRNLGISASVKSQNWTAYLGDLGRKNFQAARSAWLGDYFDPLTFLGLFVSGNRDNYTGYANPAYDALVAQAAALTGPARLRTFRQAEALLEADQPFIPIFHYTTGNRIDLDRWKGWLPNAPDVHPYKDIAPKIR